MGGFSDSGNGPEARGLSYPQRRRGAGDGPRKRPRRWPTRGPGWAWGGRAGDSEPRGRGGGLHPVGRLRAAGVSPEPGPVEAGDAPRGRVAFEASASSGPRPSTARVSRGGEPSRTSGRLAASPGSPRGGRVASLWGGSIDLSHSPCSPRGSPHALRLLPLRRLPAHGDLRDPLRVSR